MEKQTKRRFVSVNELKFVNELKKYPLLFNSQDPDYKNATKRKECWQLIGNIVGISEDDCRKRWRSLRDGYIRNQKLPLEEARKWIHWDMVNSFYEAFSDFGRRSKRSKKVQPKLEFHEETEPYYIQEQETYEETADNPLELEESQLDVDETHLEQDYDMSQNEIDDYNSCTNSTDQDQAFLQSILPILKRLPKKKNILARLKIQQILFELEFDDKYCSNMQ